jgi:hypothetical protein
MTETQGPDRPLEPEMKMSMISQAREVQMPNVSTTRMRSGLRSKNNSLKSQRQGMVSKGSQIQLNIWLAAVRTEFFLQFLKH